VTAAVLSVPVTSVVHHLRGVISDLADVVEGLELTTESVQDRLGPLPADADGTALRGAAHDAQVGANQIVHAALEIARVGGVFAAMSAVRTAAQDAAEKPEV